MTFSSRRSAAVTGWQWRPWTREAHDVLSGVLRHLSLASAAERATNLVRTLRESRSRPLVAFAAGEVKRFSLPAPDELRAAIDRQIGAPDRYTVSLIEQFVEAGGRIQPAWFDRLIDDPERTVAWRWLQHVGPEQYPRFRKPLLALLDSRSHSTRWEVYRALVRLDPESLGQAAMSEGRSACQVLEAAQALREQGRTLPGPWHLSDLLELDRGDAARSLATRVCAAWDRESSAFEALIEEIARTRPDSPWVLPTEEELGVAVRLLTPLLHDPELATSKGAAAVLRTAGIGLGPAEGGYRVVTGMVREQAPTTTLPRVTGEPRVGASLTIQGIERVTRSGTRICRAGRWRISVIRPDAMPTWTTRDDHATGAEVFEIPVGGDERQVELSTFVPAQPGRYRVFVWKSYLQDDRREGGAWTGASREAEIEIVVGP